MLVLSQVNWVLLHLAQTFLGVQIQCLCSPKTFWASPHPVFHFRAVQDHSLLSDLVLRSAQALPSVVTVINPCSVELSESNSPLKSKWSPQKLVLILSPHMAPLPVYIFQSLQIQKCCIDNIPEPLTLSLLFFFFFFFSFSFFCL